MFKKIEGQITPKMDLGSVASLVQQTLAIVCDEHTTIDLREKYQSFHRGRALIDVPFIVTNDKLYVDEDRGSSGLREVLEIGDKTADQIIPFIRSLPSADGCVKNQTLFTANLTFNNNLFLSRFLGFDAQYQILLSDPTKETYEHPKKTAINLAQFAANFATNNSPYRGIPLARLGIDPGYLEFLQAKRPNHEGIFELHNEEKGYSYIYVRHFVGGKRQADKIDQIMRGVIKRNPKYLILDLTESPGGATNQVSRLLSYFLNRSHQIAKTVYRRSRKAKLDKSFKPLSAERADINRRSARQFRKVKRRNGRHTLRIARRSFGHPNYKGDITVLVGPHTHSASTMAALILKQQRQATIVGYVQSGDTRTSCFAPDGTYTLPLTKLDVRIADTCFVRNRKSRSKSSALEPDIQVDPLAQSSEKLLQNIISAGVDNIVVKRARKKYAAAKR